MRYLLILLLLVVAFTSGQLMAEEITPRDFAAGYYLETSNNNAVHSVELPEDVYHTVKSAELHDVRVFNAAGEVVPHEFRTVITEPATLREQEIIPFFPLYQQTTPANNPAGISLQVSRDTAGAIVNIKSDPQIDPADKEIVSYLLDLSHVEMKIAELYFAWKKDLDSSVFTVNILESNDLERWMTLVHRATLADLQFGGQQVERRRVELPQQPKRYLKLTWQESRWPLRLTEIAGVSSVLEKKRHHWISLSDGTVHEKGNQLMVDFTSDYRMPTSRVQIRFPHINAVAMLAVQSRPSVGKEWTTRCEQVFHDLSFEGTAIQNQPCDFPATADPMWRVAVKQDGAGLQTGKGALTLQLGWQPNELVFIGRGTPPFLLAFGSGKLAQKGENSPTEMLLKAIPKDLGKKAISPAAISRKVSLSGDLALKEPTPPTPWKKWLLWSVLVVGVGLLAYMARSLIQEIKSADEKRVAGK